MYLITNRVMTKAKNLKAFGKTPNPKGPNELLMVNVERSGDGWKVEPVMDELPIDTVNDLKTEYSLDIDVDLPWHGSLKVACELFDQARTENKELKALFDGMFNGMAVEQSLDYRSDNNTYKL